MKKILVAFFAVVALSGSVRAELFADAVFAKLSCYTPYQIPIPWFYYVEDAAMWGEYSVYGADVGLPWSESHDVYGAGVGCYLDYTGVTAGVQCALVGFSSTLYGIQAGIFNYAETANGLQVGVVNMCECAHGLQVGVVNVIRESPVSWMPLINLHF